MELILPLFLGVMREFLSPRMLGFGPRPVELLLLATLVPATGILDTEEALLEEEEAVGMGIPLDLPGLDCPAGTWSWLRLTLWGAAWLSVPLDSLSLLCSQDLLILHTATNLKVEL